MQGSTEYWRHVVHVSGKHTATGIHRQFSVLVSLVAVVLVVVVVVIVLVVAAAEAVADAVVAVWLLMIALVAVKVFVLDRSVAAELLVAAGCCCHWCYPHAALLNKPGLGSARMLSACSQTEASQFVCSYPVSAISFGLRLG